MPVNSQTTSPHHDSRLNTHVSETQIEALVTAIFIGLIGSFLTNRGLGVHIVA